MSNQCVKEQCTRLLSLMFLFWLHHTECVITPSNRYLLLSCHLLCMKIKGSHAFCLFQNSSSNVQKANHGRGILDVFQFSLKTIWRKCRCQSMSADTHQLNASFSYHGNVLKRLKSMFFFFNIIVSNNKKKIWPCERDHCCSALFGFSSF